MAKVSDSPCLRGRCLFLLISTPAVCEGVPRRAGRGGERRCDGGKAVINEFFPVVCENKYTDTRPSSADSVYLMLVQENYGKS